MPFISAITAEKRRMLTRTSVAEPVSRPHGRPGPARNRAQHPGRPMRPLGIVATKRFSQRLYMGGLRFLRGPSCKLPSLPRYPDVTILRPLLTMLLAFSFLWSTALAVAAAAGEVRFELTDKESTVAEMFRLEPHTFPFAQEFQKTSSTAMEISLVTFPSPVVTPHPENNTVHCEYFRSLSPGKHPGVIVLHILGGDFDLSRLFCRNLAQHGISALFLESCRTTVRVGPRGSRCE